MKSRIGHGHLDKFLYLGPLIGMLFFVHIRFFHSFIPVIYIAPLKARYYSEALPTIQHGYCIGVSLRSAQATAGKGLVMPGPYVAARAGLEPTTPWLKVLVSPKPPPRPSFVCFQKQRSPNSGFLTGRLQI